VWAGGNFAGKDPRRIRGCEALQLSTPKKALSLKRFSELYSQNKLT
jgi:hypothetical protein